MPSNQYSRPTGDNGFHLEVKRSSRSQETSKVVKPKATSLDEYHVRKSQDDELVKYMSNLPAYLQRVEKGEKFQETALSFGVLDWERLEKWKSNRKCTAPRGDTTASSSISNSSLTAGESIAFSRTLQKKNLAPRTKQPSPQCPHLNSSHEGGFSKYEMDRRKDTDEKLTSEKGTSFSELRKHRLSRDSKDETSALNDGVTIRIREVQSSEYYVGQNHRRGNEKGTVFSLPKHAPKKSCSKMLNDASCTLMHPNETPATLCQGKHIDENTMCEKPLSGSAIDTSMRLNHETTEPSTVKGKHLSPNRQFSFSLRRIARSLSFRESSAVPQLRSEESDAFFSSEIFSDVLHSCPRPIRLDPNPGSDMRRHSLDASQSTEFPSYDASSSFMYPNEKILNKISRANSIGASARLDEERHRSPNRRFSFGLGSLRRSLSFKEGSNVQGSTNSPLTCGRLTSEVSDSLDSSRRNKANTSTRARSSPMRRLLDPIFKIRGRRPHHSAETAQPLTGNLNLTSKSEPVEEKKHEASTVQALLQLTIKNGLPLFKLVSRNSDILVAMRKLSTFAKDDAGFSYTFYSVCEVKKSGGWINQGHNAKKYGFSYNAVGQMKVSSSKDQFGVRESVLYSAEADQELAAIIIPDGTSCDYGDQRHKGKELLWMEDRNSFRQAETEKLINTRVIIPGGVHGLPCKGVPSPLIDRWKSGGSCDCGGWDVGCKLRILASENHRQCLNKHCFELFDQEETQDNQPIFSMRPLEKGNFSVEFSSSISMLQAFSICVVVISSQKSFDFSELNHPAEEKWLQESNRVRGEAPTKYVQSPPSSPVGRV
ncbi:hypothetical protein RHSIM_Rhsim04G0163800 [Rhododendron simsii]|uniref:Uncharacterized protein n=1 Tax=Rhododendron simsii TaxID=118357 RepID=A0A834H2T6_RHOSS|nr:hypothetical protein RHSIM_Rhsim04G0163800 [Rhododendron simsii]